MEKRILVVSRLDENGEFYHYTTFYNDFSGKYNLTTLLMQLNGCNNIWDKKLRAKFAKRIWTGKNGKNVYFEFGKYVYSCAA